MSNDAISSPDDGVGRYFPTSKPPVAEAAPKRRGRKRHDSDQGFTAELLAARQRARAPKKRHDSKDAPIDGDYLEGLSLENEDPRFEYAWIAEYDRARYLRRGYVAELWGPGCARLKYDVAPRKRGEEIRSNELTLMKCPKERVEAIRKAELAVHRGKKEASAEERRSTWRTRSDEAAIEHAIPMRG